VVGLSLGARLRVLVGASLGAFSPSRVLYGVGAPVLGALTGDWLGLPLGSELGDALGVPVGDSFGRGDGPADGLELASPVGLEEGKPDGP
jgi:hypothetical protein